MKFNRGKAVAIVKKKLLDLQKEEPTFLVYIAIKPLSVDPRTGNIMKGKFDYGHAGFIDRALSAGVLYHLEEMTKQITKRYLQAK
ncbi:MAG: hypothetical protein ACE5IT_07890 [bacterium]